MRHEVGGTVPWFYDKWIIFSFLALVTIGLVMVASASMVISDRQYHYPFHYFIHQAVYMAVGLVLLRVVCRVPMQFWQKYAGRFMLITLVLLVLVLIPGLGRVVNGSRRWLHAGPLTLQVSELAKLFAVVYLAHYLQRFQQQVRLRLIGFIKPMMLLAVLALLLLMEPDFGSLAVLTATFLIMLFIADVKLWPFIVLFLLVLGALAGLAIASPYRLLRVTTFLNPWGHQFGSGYQLTQSLIAFGRGGFFGVGLGNSIQKLFYLPEAHTDFLFAVISEELGFIGEFVIIGLFAVLIGRMIWLAKKALGNERLFSGYLLFGLASWLALQAMINIGVNAGILPTKGLTLPLISYGGSSMLVSCVAIGLCMRMAYEQDLMGATRRRRRRPYGG